MAQNVTEKDSHKTNGRLFTCPICNKSIHWNQYGICDDCRERIEKEYEKIINL